MSALIGTFFIVLVIVMAIWGWSFFKDRERDKRVNLAKRRTRRLYLVTFLSPPALFKEPNPVEALADALQSRTDVPFEVHQLSDYTHTEVVEPHEGDFLGDFDIHIAFYGTTVEVHGRGNEGMPLLPHILEYLESLGGRAEKIDVRLPTTGGLRAELAGYAVQGFVRWAGLTDSGKLQIKTDDSTFVAGHGKWEISRERSRPVKPWPAMVPHNNAHGQFDDAIELPDGSAIAVGFLGQLLHFVQGASQPIEWATALGYRGRPKDVHFKRVCLTDDGALWIAAQVSLEPTGLILRWYRGQFTGMQIPLHKQGDGLGSETEIVGLIVAPDGSLLCMRRDGYWHRVSIVS